MVSQKRFVLVALVLCSALFTGCSSGESDGMGEGTGAPNGAGKDKMNNDPITLQLYQYSSSLADEEFEMYFAQPVKKKFPHVTLELVRYGKGTELRNLVATGSVPDLFYISQAKFPEVFDLNLQYNLSDLATKNKFDLGRFKSEALEGIQVFSPQDGLYGLPFSMNSSALFYNKDIFDKFGQSYPKDGMLWDEVIEIGSKLSRTESGIAYKAFTTLTLPKLAEQLAAPYTDSQTDTPLLESDSWKKAALLYKRIIDIPGNGKVSASLFSDQRVVAMSPNTAVAGLATMKQAWANGNPMNWDLVSYPSFPGAVGKAMNATVQILAVSSTSKNKELAFQILSFITNDENQLNVSRSGRISPLKDKTIEAQFATDSEALAGKNLRALFLNTPNVPLPGKYDSSVGSILNKEIEHLENGTKDVNTFLRDANELAGKAIQADKAANGLK